MDSLVRMGGPNDDNLFDRDPTARPASPQQAPAPPQQAPASPQQAPASPQQAPASPQQAPASPQQAPASPQQAPASPQQAPAPRLRNRQRNQPAPNQVAVPRQQLAGRMLQNQRQQSLQQPAVRNWRREDLPRNLNLQQQWPVLPQARFLEQNLNPLEMFKLFVDDEVVDYIVHQTNLYARRDKGNHNFVTTRQEFHTFMAILLLSGYN
ncbi:hypothetical protein ACOMHN_013367 [Nucella lapillus]